MKQYLDLLVRVMSFGNDKGNRTGKWARSVFGHQMSFDLLAGFPAVTSKKLFHKGYVHELLMFIAGKTNNEYLLAQNVHIWDGWQLQEDVVRDVPLTKHERAVYYAESQSLPIREVEYLLTRMDSISKTDLTQKSGEAFLDSLQVPNTRREVLIKQGELGPVYGDQWRSWKGANGETVDQLAEVIKLLRTNPDSRRMIISAWNVTDLPDESVSPQENVKNGKMALAACHCLFQFYTTPLSLDERIAAHNVRLDIIRSHFQTQPESLTENVSWMYLSKHVLWGLNTKGIHSEENFTDQDASDALDRMGVPSRSLSCQLYQRSCDLFLGVPFNIASYALLTHMVAQVCNMAVGEFIWTGGDCHIYNNHFDQVNEQLQRAPMQLSRLWLNPEIKEIDDFKFDDIKVLDYVSHPAIKGEVSV